MKYIIYLTAVVALISCSKDVSSPGSVFEDVLFKYDNTDIDEVISLANPEIYRALHDNETRQGTDVEVFPGIYKECVDGAYCEEVSSICFVIVYGLSGQDDEGDDKLDAILAKADAPVHYVVDDIYVVQDAIGKRIEVIY